MAQGLSFTIKKDLHFVKHRKKFYAVTCIILVIGLGFGLIRGLNYGIDFTGGTNIQVEMGEQVDIDDVKDTLKEFDLDPQIIYAGEGNTQLVIKTIKSLENAERAEIVKALGADPDDVLASEQFGPSVGDELKANAIKSVVIASIGMLIYIIFRFKAWQFGIASIIG